eukprot:m.198601 g.198601  ORF g.198601 m.198601 type:complete len:737 (+) comp17042_c0_seq10:240-2450(+)
MLRSIAFVVAFASFSLADEAVKLAPEVDAHDESLARVLDSQPNAKDALAAEQAALADGAPLLADILNSEDGEEALLVKTGDKLINFRSKRLIQTFEEKRKEIITMLASHVAVIRNETTLSKGEQTVRIEALNMTMKHINSTFVSYIKNTNELQAVLQNDFSSFQSIMAWQQKLTEEQRRKIAQLQVQAMREHAALERLEENQELILAFEEERLQPQGHVDKVSLMLSEVEGTANALQRFLDDHAFMKAQNVKHASLITVVKIKKAHDSGSTEKPVESRSKRNEQQEMTWLVDADNNQFALTRPADTTQLLEDTGLLNDLLRLVIACFIAGALCTSLNIPAFVGYVCAGTILGPAGLNVVTTIVQITTIGDLGVFFVLFTLGMEFSLETLRSTFRVAVVGGTLYTLFTIVGVACLGSFLNIPLSEMLFVGIVISLSSTTVAANNLTHAEHDAPHGRSLLGILLMQDVYLGVVVAASPMLASFGNISFLDVMYLSAWLVGSFIVLGIITAILTKYVVGRLLSNMSLLDAPTQLLAVLSICFAMLKVTEHMEVSMELGCFLAGLMFSMSESKMRHSKLKGTISASSLNAEGHVAIEGHGMLHQLMVMVEPVKDLFLVIFFASVGMHVYPTFLATNAFLLLVLTTIVLLLKWLAGVCVFYLGLRAVDARTAHVLSVGLAQISEFAFVLASRGRRLGILSQPIYFLLLSVTGLSLLLAPFFWSLVGSSRRKLLASTPTVSM